MSIPSASHLILGKTIVGVIKKDNVNPFGRPASQVFLLFNDNTYYEIYSFSDLFGGDGIESGGIEKVHKYMRGGMKVVFEVFSAELDQED